MRWLELGEDGDYVTRNDSKPDPVIDRFFVDEAECRLFVRFVLLNTASRRRNKRSKEPLRGLYTNSQGNSGVRGSDRRERIFVAVAAYRHLGEQPGKAAAAVADVCAELGLEVGETRRGRPRKYPLARDLMRQMDIIRSIHSMYRGSLKSSRLEAHVGQYWWWREWVLHTADQNLRFHLERVERVQGVARRRAVASLIAEALEMYRDKQYFPPEIDERYARLRQYIAQKPLVEAPGGVGA
jgi:hypothetical protein